MVASDGPWSFNAVVISHFARVINSWPPSLVKSCAHPWVVSCHDAFRVVAWDALPRDGDKTGEMRSGHSRTLLPWCHASCVQPRHFGQRSICWLLSRARYAFVPASSNGREN